MANTKEFFTKNKKAIYIGGGLLIAGTASYFIFGYKGKDGKTLYGKWTKKPEEEKPKTNLPPVKSGGGISLSPAFIKAQCDKIPALTHDELVKRLQYTGVPTTDDALRIKLRQKIGCL